MHPTRRFARIAAATLAALAATTAAHADPGYAYRSLQVEGAVSTMATGINERGEVVGSFQVERGPDLLIRSFSYKNGSYQKYPTTGPAVSSLDDVNDRRHVVANVVYRDFTAEAFFGDLHHRTTLAVPGAIQTHAYALNDLDVVAGAYDHDPNHLGIATTSAFTWSAADGYQTFDVPGAAGLTIAWGVDRAGTTVGVYIDADGLYHGFVRTRDGQVRTVDHPGSPYTQLMGINARGDIVGFYQDPTDFNLKGFVLSGTSYTSIAPAEAVNGSYPYRITDDGRIVGYWLDANYRSFGFIATPELR